MSRRSRRGVIAGAKPATGGGGGGGTTIFHDDFSTETAGSALSGQNGWTQLPGPGGSGAQVLSGPPKSVGGSSTTNYSSPVHDVGRNLGLKLTTHFDGADTFAVVVFANNAGGNSYTYVYLDNGDAGAVVQVVGGVAGPTRALTGTGAASVSSAAGTMEVTISATGLVSVRWDSGLTGLVAHGSYQLTSTEIANLAGNYAGFGAYHQDITDFLAETA